MGGPRKIDVAILATALIAKATDARVNALTLKLEAGERSYSARVIADKMLAPGVRLAGPVEVSPVP